MQCGLHVSVMDVTSSSNPNGKRRVLVLGIMRSGR